MTLGEPRKLNVGRNRSAGAVLDEELMREALEALEMVVPLVESMIATGSIMSRGVRTEPALDTITKLEQRLLNE
jgi:hypothetical protein